MVLLFYIIFLSYYYYNIYIKLYTKYSIVCSTSKIKHVTHENRSMVKLKNCLSILLVVVSCYRISFSRRVVSYTH